MSTSVHLFRTMDTTDDYEIESFNVNYGIAATIPMLSLGILIVCICLFYWIEPMLPRIRVNTSNDQQSQNEEDIEMGNANTEISQETVFEDCLSG